MKKHNSLDERKKELQSTGLCGVFDFIPENKTRIEDYTFNFDTDREGLELLKLAHRELRLENSQLERIERIVKAIIKLDNKVTAEACHIAEAVQYVAR